MGQRSKLEQHSLMFTELIELTKSTFSCLNKGPRMDSGLILLLYSTRSFESLCKDSHTNCFTVLHKNITSIVLSD